MELLAILLILLVVTRCFGELAERVGQPALFGELVAGVVLGVVAAKLHTALPILQDLPHDKVFLGIADLGMFFLMLLAGIEMQPRDFVESSWPAFLVALGGFILPMGLGMALGAVVLPPSSYKFAQVLFLGTSLAVTCVPVTVRLLMDLGRLNTRAGKTIVSAALFDDVLSLVVLAVLTAVIRGGALPTAGALAPLGGKVVLFFLITIPVGWFVFPFVGSRLKLLRLPEVDFSTLVIGALAYAVLAELLELHFILGAFVAGVFFERQTVDPEIFQRVQQQVSGVATGFLAPIFFAYIGLNLDLAAVKTIPGMVIVLCVIAMVGKLLGAGLPALWAGMSRAEARVIGAGMCGRGAVELVIADVALRSGLFDYPKPTPTTVCCLFSAVVIMAIVTTLLTPILLRRACAELPHADAQPCPAESSPNRLG